MRNTNELPRLGQRLRMSASRAPVTELGSIEASNCEATRFRLSQMPPSIRALYDEFPEASERVVASTDYLQLPTDRTHLLRSWMIGMQIDYDNKGRIFHELAFGKNPDERFNSSYDVWKNIAAWIAQMDGTHQATVNADEISILPTILEGSLIKHKIAHPESEMQNLFGVARWSDSVVNVISENYSPLIKIGDRWEFRSNVAFQHLLSDYILDNRPSTGFLDLNKQDQSLPSIFKRMEEVGMFDLKKEYKFRLAASLTAEKLLLQFPPIPEEFVSFLVTYAQRLGGIEGFGAANWILDDISQYIIHENEWAEKPEFKKNTHFRSGKIDEWREMLTPEQAKRVSDMIPERLFNQFGWERN